MTRKKYERDTYYEELEEALQTTSESEEEVLPMTDDEQYHYLLQYLEYEIDIYWVRRWVSACDLHELMKQKTVDRDFRAFLTGPEELQMCKRLKSIIRHMCITIEILETPRRINHVLCGLLEIRNKFEIVVPRTRFHWTRNIHRQLTRRR